jgi:hypothetical protein
VAASRGIFSKSSFTSYSTQHAGRFFDDYLTCPPGIQPNYFSAIKNITSVNFWLDLPRFYFLIFNSVGPQSLKRNWQINSAHVNCFTKILDKFVLRKLVCKLPCSVWKNKSKSSRRDENSWKDPLELKQDFASSSSLTG